MRYQSEKEALVWGIAPHVSEEAQKLVDVITVPVTSTFNVVFVDSY